MVPKKGKKKGRPDTAPKYKGTGRRYRGITAEGSARGYEGDYQKGASQDYASRLAAGFAMLEDDDAQQ